MLTTKGKTKLRKALRGYFGHSNLQKIRKTLKDSSVDSYGCKHIKIEIQPGVHIGYTSNANHFCKYFVNLEYTGMTNTLALTKKDYTKAGIKRCIGEPTSYAL